MISLTRFNEALAAKGWPFAEFARRAGLDESSRRSWQNKIKRGVRSDVIIRICKTLEVSADWLLELSSSGGPRRHQNEQVYTHPGAI